MVKIITTKRRVSAVSQALRSVTSKIENESAKELIKPFKLKTRLARTKEDLQKVFELAYEVYLEKGYAFHHDTKMETSIYDAHKDSLILLVENDNHEAVGSITLYYDDSKLVPADNIFNEELNLLRKEGIKFAEVSRFVVKQDYQHNKEILLSLINTIYIHAFRIMNIDEFIIEVNPRHVDYYKKLLGYVQFGEVKECPRVNNAPAVLLRGNKEKYLKIVDHCEYEKRTLYNSFMPKNNEESIIYKLQEKHSMSIADQKYFGLI